MIYGGESCNVVTKAPQESAGGLLRLTAGELATMNLDLRWAGELARGWHGKLLAGYRAGDTFARSRRGAAEYSVPCGPATPSPCLPQEQVDPAAEVDIRSGALRFDKDFRDRPNGRQRLLLARTGVNFCPHQGKQQR